MISFDDDVDLSPGAMAASAILPLAFITAVLIGVFYCYQKSARSHRSDARGRRGGVAAARGSRSTSSSSSVVAATNPQNSATSEATSEATSVVEVPAAALAAAQSTEDLLQFSLDALKAALMARGVKCGGTHVERVTRLFSIRNLSADQIDPKLRALAKKEAAATAKPG